MSQFKTRMVTETDPHVTLKLDHWLEDLTPAQKAYYNQAEKEFKNVTSHLHDLIKTHQADVIESGDDVMLLQLNGTTINAANPLLKKIPSAPLSTIPNQPLQNTGPQGQSVLLQSPPALCPTGPTSNLTIKSPTQATQLGGSGGTIQLLMSPRLGLIVGQVPGQEGAAQTCSIAQQNAVQTMTVPTQPITPQIVEARPPPPQNQAPLTLSLTRVSKTSPLLQQSFALPLSTSTTQPKLVFSVATSTSSTSAPVSNVSVKPRILPAISHTTVASTTTTNSTKTVAATILPNVLSKTQLDKPIGAASAPGNKGIRVATAVAGSVKVGKELPAGSCSTTTNAGIRCIASTFRGVDMSVIADEEQSNIASDSREVAFNKLAGKTFPSLVVIARPHLRDMDMTAQFINKERAVLDAEVKNVLIYSPTKLTEWLIQQGLVRSEQVCPVHTGPDGRPAKLKLGMYSDVSKFPFSGGYVWISDCCPHRFVSVFSGSIFEGSPHPPSTLLKLIYHWCCHTSVQNVVHWVKVDNFYVKNFYTNMRTICTAAVHEKYDKIGGKDKPVEIGIISLTTAYPGCVMQQMKVDILGVMDPENKRIRLRAVDPPADCERAQKRRFMKLLEPLEQWVDKESIIITDFSVDKSTLHTMGFRHVHQAATSEHRSGLANHNVMEYLRKVIPTMFQSTLGLLSRQILQQFLDELTWRERWGYIPVEAFNNLILHLSQQTKLNSGTAKGESLLLRLARIASNPFRDWKYANCMTPAGGVLPLPAVGAVPSPTARTPALAPLSSGSRPLVKIAPNGPAATNAVSSSSDAQNIPAKRNIPAKKHTGPRNCAAKELEASQNEAEEISIISHSTSSSTNINGPPSVSDSVIGEPDNAATDTNSSKTKSDKFDKLIPLEDYYYGSKPGDPAVISREYKVDNLNTRCCICQEIFQSNIDLMVHIMAHTYQKKEEGNPPLKDVANRMCRYCLAVYPHPRNTISHADEVHRNLDFRPTCRICEKKFRDRQSLIAHMHRLHHRLEMPYRCGICEHRSSQKRVIIDHFYEVHANGEELQCPFCLRCVAISKNGRKNHTNNYYFYTHVRKHQLQYLTKSCSKCSLTYVNKEYLKEHLKKDHISYFGDQGVLKYSETCDAEQVMMPVPPTPKACQVPAPETPPKSAPLQMLPFTSHPSGVRVIEAFENDTCIECQCTLLDTNHFSEYVTCLFCRYATYCSKAMEKHSVTAHSKEKGVCYPSTNLLMLPSCLFCPCGFNSCNTNSLAPHLGLCKFSTLYPYKHLATKAAEIAREAAEAAKQIDAEEEEATTPLLTMPEDGDDDRVCPEVLNRLGLMSKRPAEVDEAAQDEAAQDEAAQDEAAQDEAAQDEAAQDEAAQDEAAQDEAAQDEAAQDEAAQDEAAQDEAAQDEAVQDEAAQNEAAQNEAAQNEAPLVERPQVKRKRGRPRSRPRSRQSVSSSESRKRRRGPLGLYRDFHESDTESVDDVASLAGSEDSWSTASTKSTKQKKTL